MIKRCLSPLFKILVWKTVRPNKRRQTKIPSCENDRTSHQNLRTMPFSLQYKRFWCDFEKWFRKVIVICFISQWMKRSKHGLLVFPPKKTLIWRRHCSSDQSCYSMTSKRFLESSSGMKFFQPSVRLTNQKPRAFVSVRQTNQIDLFPFVCCFCLFARFHFKVIRKSLYSHVFVLPSLQPFNMISDNIE